MPTDPTTALFTRSTAVASLRADRLTQVLSAYAPDATFSDDYLWDKLRAAEADAERQLRVLFSPTQIVPQGEAPPEAGRWLEEPGYDFDPDLFAGDRWGLLETRQRPIIAIQQIQFAWPSPGLGTAFTVPHEWLRVDKKYGQINLVPTAQMMALPLNTFLLTALGGGRRVPLMVQIRYTAGLQDAVSQYPDLKDLVQKMAVLALLNDLYLPQSGSISADGLSQSTSFDADKYQSLIDHKLDTLRQALHGVRMVVV